MYVVETLVQFLAVFSFPTCFDVMICVKSVMLGLPQNLASSLSAGHNEYMMVATWSYFGVWSRSLKWHVSERQ